jgi:hypothetical protein
MHTGLKIKLPKNASQILANRAKKAVAQLEAGTAKIRKSERFGYKTLALGRCERAVINKDTFIVFSKHRDYEKSIQSDLKLGTEDFSEKVALNFRQRHKTL